MWTGRRAQVQLLEKDEGDSRQDRAGWRRVVYGLCCTGSDST